MIKKQKQGLSEIIGYVLLIVIAISLSLLVYAWLKNQVPKETQSCQENLALSIQRYECFEESIEVTIKNNGLFDINGLLARYAVKESGLASKDMQGLSPVRSSGQILKAINSSLSFVEEFEYPIDRSMVEIEITPIKLIDGKMTICTNSAVRQKIEC